MAHAVLPAAISLGAGLLGKGLRKESQKPQSPFPMGSYNAPGYNSSTGRWGPNPGVAPGYGGGGGSANALPPVTGPLQYNGQYGSGGTGANGSANFATPPRVQKSESPAHGSNLYGTGPATGSGGVTGVPTPTATAPVNYYHGSGDVRMYGGSPDPNPDRSEQQGYDYGTTDGAPVPGLPDTRPGTSGNPGTVGPGSGVAGNDGGLGGFPGYRDPNFHNTKTGFVTRGEQPAVTAEPGTKEYRRQMGALTAWREDQLKRGASLADVGANAEHGIGGNPFYKQYASGGLYSTYGGGVSGNFIYDWQNGQKLNVATANPGNEQGLQPGTKTHSKDGQQHFDPNDPAAWQTGGEAIDENEKRAYQEWQQFAAGHPGAGYADYLAWQYTKDDLSRGHKTLDPQTGLYFNDPGNDATKRQYYDEYGRRVDPSTGQMAYQAWGTGGGGSSTGTGGGGYGWNNLTGGGSSGGNSSNSWSWGSGAGGANIASLLSQGGSGLLDTGRAGYSDAMRYYSDILSGNAGRATAAVAPQSEQLQKLGAGARSQVESSYLRGGAKDKALANVQQGTQNAADSLVINARPEAANALMSGGIAGANAGTGALGTGGSLLNQLTGMGQQNDQFYANLNQQDRQFGSDLDLRRSLGFGGLDLQRMLGLGDLDLRGIGLNQNYALGQGGLDLQRLLGLSALDLQKLQMQQQGKQNLGQGIGGLLGLFLNAANTFGWFGAGGGGK